MIPIKIPTHRYPKSLRKCATIVAASFAALMIVNLAVMGASDAEAASGVAPLDNTLPTAGAPYGYGPTDRFTLGGQWWFRPDPTDSGLSQGLRNFTDSTGWAPVSIPHNWNAGDDSEASYRGTVGWYAREFRTPKSGKRAKWVLRFESVNYNATVWLNGVRIGTHAGAAIPFELDAKSLKPGINRLVVRVDSRLHSSTLPPVDEDRFGDPTGGWWNFGGILREVIMRRAYEVDMDDLAIETRLPCSACSATVELKAHIRNMGKRKLKLRLTGRFGSQSVRFPIIKLPAFQSATVSARAVIDDPELWSPDDPNLYGVAVTVSGKRVRPATYRLKTGIRSLRVNKKGELLLNGDRTSLLGTSMHEIDQAEGAAWSAAKRNENLTLLENLGAEVVRSHYPLHPAVLEWADSHGVMIWEQVPVYRVSGPILAKSAFRNRAVSYLRQMVIRDRSHPAMLAYSLGNEVLSPGGEAIDKYIAAAVKAARILDPDGLIAIDTGSSPTSDIESSAFERLDLLGLSEYFGWYPGPSGSIQDRSGLPAYLDLVHATYPRQALFVSEFGAEASREGPADEKGTYAYQTNLLRDQLRMIMSRPYINGAFPWVLRDYWVRPGWDGGNPNPVPPWSSKGIVDRNGTPKPAFGEVAKIFKATPPVR